MNDLLPSPSNYPAYVRAVAALPTLSVEEEHALVQAWRLNQNRDAAKTLVLSHLRLVTSVVKDHEGYGLPPADLAQEGTVGLMKAVHRFDPSKGVRLGTYAWYWIEAEIKEFILKNWRLISWGTSTLAKKMFFGYRKTVQQLKEWGDHREVPSVKAIAQALDVSEEDARMAQAYFTGNDVHMEYEDGEEKPLLALPAPNSDPLEMVEQDQHQHALHVMKQLVHTLPEREQDIISKRYLYEPPQTLQQLSQTWNISIERVRQLEKEGLKKLRKHMLELPSPA